MRWFKHMALSSDDEKLARLQDMCGLEGYGFWWRMVEIIAQKVEKNSEPSVFYSVSKWCSLLGIHHHKFRKLLKAGEECGLYSVVTSSLLDSYPPSNSEVTMKYALSTVGVKIPNILKFRDEYSRKSGQYPDKLRSKNTDTETEIRKREDVPSSRRRNEKTKTSPEQAKPKAKEKAFAEDSTAYRLAQFMRDTLVANVPTLKEPDLQKWAADFDVSLRNDERMQDARFTAQVIKWACSDPFWKSNIQSPKKLREKFDQLTARMESIRASPANGNGNGNGRPVANTQYQKGRQDMEDLAKFLIMADMELAQNGNNAANHGRIGANGNSLPANNQPERIAATCGGVVYNMQ